MPEAVERDAPSADTPAPPSAHERDRQTLLKALRVARARLRALVLEVDDIGVELKDGRLTPVEALRRCHAQQIDALFPREGDGD